jgi:hypothetical protein
MLAVQHQPSVLMLKSMARNAFDGSVICRFLKHQISQVSIAESQLAGPPFRGWECQDPADLWHNTIDLGPVFSRIRSPCVSRVGAEG